MARSKLATFQLRVLNPFTKLSIALGISPPIYALLETIGRKSGEPRRTPIGNGLVGDTFWIVAEAGTKAAYVRNIAANPRVRVKVRAGWRLRWREGTAHLLPDDDARARQDALSAGNRGRARNAALVRAFGDESQLLTVRIDLLPR